MTKEDFWNGIKEKYPSHFEKFSVWIDEYKKKNDWNKLFNAQGEGYENPKIVAPKYHDLPAAMQIGIFTQFVSESDPVISLEIDTDRMDKILWSIEDWFRINESFGAH